MKSNKSFFGIFLAVLVLLPGCILHVPRYTRQPLSMVSDNFAYNETQGNLNVRVKQLSSSDKHYLFDSRSELVQRNTMRVVYISIHNFSNTDYVISPTGISLKQVSCSDIDKSMKKTSTVGRLAVVGLGVGSNALASGIFSVISELGSGLLGLVVIVPALVLSAVGFVLVPIGLAQGIKSIVMNSRISKDLKEKTLHEKVIINSGEQYEGLIFIKPLDYRPQFTVTMHEKDNIKNSVTFGVDLRQNEFYVPKIHE